MRRSAIILALLAFLPWLIVACQESVVNAIKTPIVRFGGSGGFGTSAYGPAGWDVRFYAGNDTGCSSPTNTIATASANVTFRLTRQFQGSPFTRVSSKFELRDSSGEVKHTEDIDTNPASCVVLSLTLPAPGTYTFRLIHVSNPGMVTQTDTLTINFTGVAPSPVRSNGWYVGYFAENSGCASPISNVTSSTYDISFMFAMNFVGPTPQTTPPCTRGNVTFEMYKGGTLLDSGPFPGGNADVGCQPVSFTLPENGNYTFRIKTQSSCGSFNHDLPITVNFVPTPTPPEPTPPPPTPTPTPTPTPSPVLSNKWFVGFYPISSTCGQSPQITTLNTDQANPLVANFNVSQIFVDSSGSCTQSATTWQLRQGGTVLQSGILGVANITCQPTTVVLPTLGATYTYRLTTTSSCGGTSTRDLTIITPPPPPSPVTVSTVAGSGTPGDANGTGTGASFRQPWGIAVHPGTGAIYVADSFNHTIRRINGSTVITLLGQSGQTGFANGSGSSARFHYPRGLAFDNSGSVLYVTDAYLNKVRAISIASNTVSDFAGSGTSGSTDGSTTNARFAQPWDLDVGADGAVYVSDSGNMKIRKIKSGTVSTVATLTSSPRGISVSPEGAVYVALPFENKIVKVPPNASNLASNDPSVITVAPATQPWDVLYDSRGLFYTSGNFVYQLPPGGALTVIAGDGSPGLQNGSPANSKVYDPRHLAINGKYVYFTEYGNHTVRRVEMAY